MRRAAPPPTPDRLPASLLRAPPCSTPLVFPRELVPFWCLERVKTKLAAMRKPPLASQRRLSSFRFELVDLRRLALSVLCPPVRQTSIRVDRLCKSSGNVAFALVEESRAAQPVLQRHRRIVGTWTAIGALDPGFAWQPVVIGVASL